MRHERHFNITMTSWIDVRPAVGVLFFYLSLGLVWVCEISHMGKDNGNLGLVCEKKLTPTCQKISDIIVKFKKRTLHECSCFIEFIKRVWD